MLTATELRKLVRAHNILSKITIPKGSNRDDIIKIIENAGYKVNHEEKKLEQKVKRGKQLTLKKAEEITKPKPKTELQKQKAEEKKQEKELERKKKEREIRKKSVEEEKKRQKDIKDKSISINNIETKKMPPKITAEQMKSIKVIEPKKKDEEIKVGDKITFSLPTDKSIKIDGEVERINKNSYTISFEETPEIKKAVGTKLGYRYYKRDGKNIITKTYTKKQLQR